MNILASGMEWVTERPGGLKRYFADFLAAWTESGGSAQALVRSADPLQALAFPPYVRTVPDSGESRLRYLTRWRDVLRAELREQRFDLFNPHFAYYAQAWLTSGSDIPVVTNFQGPWAYEVKVEQGERSRLRDQARFYLQRHLERRFYRRSDRFIVLSRAFGEILARDYGVPRERIHVIPGAADVERFQAASDRMAVRARLGLPQDAYVLVVVRRLARRMGLANLLRAFAAVCGDFPDALLLVVGGGELRLELEALARELGLDGRVQFAGRVAEEELPLYYQAADLSVVPSVALEGFGLVTVEAMACGTPVMGTPVGGTAEILSGFDDRLLFRGTAPEDLAAGLVWALDHRDELPSRALARAHVMEHYTWDIAIPRIRDVFELAVNGR